jgi:isoleucyl-tRNA synthetase
MTKKPFPQIEEEIMKKWDDDKTFEKSIENRDEKDLYVFYDGPPFATGTPHYGHIVAGTLKDVVPRYWTMKGKRVERKWGWDTHGLPVENIVEKEMKISGREAIEEVGVAKFNDACRSKVMLYADEWKKIVKRLGRWVDMENDYKTMDKDFMESVWWVFKSMYDKGLAYEGYKSMHICPRCETTLSNIEIGEGYKDVKDLSVTAKFELVDEPRTYVLSWTTTPWTLPGNVALAVGAKFDYIKVKIEDDIYITLKDNHEEVLKDKSFEIVGEMKGAELEGKRYKPLFDFYVDKELENKENIYTIVIGDFVSTEDGTGVVHLAPAFGEDDMNIGKEKNLPFIQHVKLNGKFTDDVEPWAGIEVKPKEDPSSTDVLIIKYLAGRSLLFSKEKYEHSYPHCWRCDSPLLNYATGSWFFAVEKIKDELLKNAKEVNWVPAHIKEGRFGNWLEGAHDWSISRSRYWGNPMPIWKCEGCADVKVLGSAEELEKLSGKEVPDLHKHFVDELTFPCEKCGGTMKRISEVFDCWVESASMPYGQMHYPFENQEKFEKNFPAEFIAEGVDQTRAWFYVLHVLSTGVFNKPAYKNVVVNGIVLAEDGQKMSKRKQNYPDPMEIVNKYGADALRYYLTTSSVMRAEDLRFSEKGVDEVYKKVVLMSMNILSFYKMFEKDDELDFVPSGVNNVLDKWIIAKTNDLVLEVTSHMDGYDLPRASKPIAEFINELSTWYVRRCRDRFKQDNNTQAVLTLRYALGKLALVMAPFMPYLSEHINSEIGNTDSVHLQDWPNAEELLIKKDVLSKMKKARLVTELGLAARDEAKIKVRQPLEYLWYRADDLGSEYNEVIAAELNVKEVRSIEGINEKANRITKEDSGLKVSLKIEISEELMLEGLVRELTRQINNLRRQKGLTIEDKVKLVYNTSGTNLQKFFSNSELVEKLKAATLLTDIESGTAENEVKINDELIKISLID